MPSGRNSPGYPGVVRTLWIAVVCALLTCSPVRADTIAGRVVTVHDGDTVTVATATGRIKVRLVGIDSPELGQKWASQARDFTASLVLNKTVVVETTGSDQYGRLLGDIRVDGVDVNEAIVRKGMAWRYDLGGADSQIVAAERAARAEHAGLWTDPSPIPPWQWRRMHPQRDAAGARSGTPYASSHADRTPRLNIEDARGPFHGNTRSHLFHRPGCPHYNCKSCDEAFLTVQSAEEAGYTPAGDCLRN